MFNEEFLDRLATAVAEKVVNRINAPPAERVTKDSAVDAGAPSWRWVEDRAREGKIEIKGPRGARYVERADLVALVAATTIHRARKPLASCTSVEDDARDAVAALAARRVAG